MEEPKNIIIYGRHPVTDAIKAGKTFEKIMFQQGLTGDIEMEIRKLCRENQIPLSIVPREKLGKMANGANHQGVIGFIALLDYTKLEDIVPHMFLKKGKHRFCFY